MGGDPHGETKRSEEGEARDLQLTHRREVHAELVDVLSSERGEDASHHAKYEEEHADGEGSGEEENRPPRPTPRPEHEEELERGEDDDHRDEYGRRHLELGVVGQPGEQPHREPQRAVPGEEQRRAEHQPRHAVERLEAQHARLLHRRVVAVHAQAGARADPREEPRAQQQHGGGHEHHAHRQLDGAHLHRRLRLRALLRLCLRGLHRCGFARAPLLPPLFFREQIDDQVVLLPHRDVESGTSVLVLDADLRPIVNQKLRRLDVPFLRGPHERRLLGVLRKLIDMRRATAKKHLDLFGVVPERGVVEQAARGAPALAQLLVRLGGEGVEEREHLHD
mmetsp:Transcript_44322/g.78218  ORF Transcript_44322/g.78218 Transcript_44322/m.78218 type:complete len:336 (+) Transcript_44322:671-1678(+)